VRLPLTAFGGPPSNQPVLLTPTGDSGISGNRADIALVRHGGSEVTYWGFPFAGAGTSAPLFKHQGALAPGKTASLSLAQGPPASAAFLVMGLYPSPVVVQGQVVMPAPQALLPAVTSANGAASFALKLPVGAAGSSAWTSTCSGWPTTRRPRRGATSCRARRRSSPIGVK
jgi:hypothetical protein